MRSQSASSVTEQLWKLPIHYWADGRVAMTTGGPKDDGGWGADTVGAVTLEASSSSSSSPAAAVIVKAASVWEMGSIWLPKESLRQPADE